MKAFTVDYVSPMSFHNLAAEICFDGQILCRIKSERPDGVVEADFFYERREPLRPLTVPLTEFLALVKEIMDEVASLRSRAEPT